MEFKVENNLIALQTPIGNIAYYVIGMPEKLARKYLYQPYIKKQLQLIVQGHVNNLKKLKSTKIVHENICPKNNNRGFCNCACEVSILEVD